MINRLLFCLILLTSALEANNSVGISTGDFPVAATNVVAAEPAREFEAKAELEALRNIKEVFDAGIALEKKIHDTMLESVTMPARAKNKKNRAIDGALAGALPADFLPELRGIIREYKAVFRSSVLAPVATNFGVCREVAAWNVQYNAVLPHLVRLVSGFSRQLATRFVDVAAPWEHVGFSRRGQNLICEKCPKKILYPSTWMKPFHFYHEQGCSFWKPFDSCVSDKNDITENEAINWLNSSVQEADDLEQFRKNFSYCCFVYDFFAHQHEASEVASRTVTAAASATAAPTAVVTTDATTVSLKRKAADSTNE